MKLQKLIIHNIASIEDATIDFDAKPLSDSEVFLITGKTGSGKSTILDAICLALYAKTPRFENTEIKGETVDVQSTLKVDDTRQLLRRNTGEGFVELTFIGSNNIDYKATWSVSRARNRVNGNLQNKKWSITNLKTGKIYTKKNDNEAAIAEAIGLDFNQFCRTTILAQGDFTRFLNSDDDAKATILEKITGVDVYTKIGAKVYELTSSHKNDYENSRRQLEGVKILTEDEVAEKNAKIKSLHTEVEQNEKVRAQIGDKLAWLTDDAKLRADAEKAKADYERAVEQQNSDDYREKSLLIEDWNRTIDVRKTQSDIVTAANRCEELKAKIETGKATFANLRNGIAWREDQLEHLQTEVKALQTAVDAEASNATIYNNVQAIDGNVKTIIGNRKRIADSEAKIKDSKDNLEGKLAEDLQKVNQRLEEVNGKIATSRTKIDVLNNELKVLNVTSLRSKRDELVAQTNDIELAKTKLEVLQREIARVAQAQSDLNELAAKIETKRAQVDALDKELKAADERTEELRLHYEAQKQTVDDWAKDIRRKLKLGDTCPVCGKAIDAALPDESSLAELYKLAEDAYNKARLASEDLRKQFDSLNAEVKAAVASYESSSKTLAADKSVENAKADALQKCKQFAIEAIDDATATKLDEVKAKINEQLVDIDKTISVADSKQRSVDEEQKMLELHHKALELANADKTRADKACDDCRNVIKNETASIEERRGEITKAIEAVDQTIAGSAWQATWQENPTQFVADLSAKAKQYNDKVENLRVKDHALSVSRTAKQNEDDAYNKILTIIPESTELTFALPTEVENLLSELNNLYAELKSAQDGIVEAEKARADAQERLNVFLAEHPEVSEERLSRLAALKPEAIEKHRKTLEQIRAKVQETKAQLDRLNESQQAHLGKRPDLAEDETEETLKAKTVELDGIISNLNEQVGGLKRDLEQDEANKNSRRELIAEVERLRGIYERWSKLNDLIGSSDGKNFRKIAQSYVLGSLINCANKYMGMLTGRYKLFVTPGTFVISLIDAYQGGVKRAATTISGGESFLVSLSLALALADIGKQLAVDTMFIDEGFGTLSGEPLRCAVDTLKSLHSTAGRHVGIISHVEELRERIPVQIQVNQEGNNSSSQIQVVTI
jgi:exonuclease SbcC